MKYKAMDRAAKRNLLVMLGIIFVIGFLFSPGFAKIIILLVAAGLFYYFLFRVKTVAHTQQTQKEPEQKEQSAAPCGKMARTRNVVNCGEKRQQREPIGKRLQVRSYNMFHKRLLKNFPTTGNM